MKNITKKQILASNKALSALGATSPSAFMPKADVKGVAFPCCCCLRLDLWTAEQCQKSCHHFPNSKTKTKK